MISKTQPMREAEIAIVDFCNGEVSPYMEKETKERKEADLKLQNNIDTEASRAKEAETTLQTNIDTEVSRAKSAETTLQTNINSEVSRAKSAETTLQTNIGTEVSRAKSAEATINNKFPIQTENIGDSQITKTKLSTDLQTLITFCETLPDFEFGYSNALTINANSFATFEITFSKTKSETPAVIVSAQGNTTNNISAHVQFATLTNATVIVYNNSDTQVSNVTIDYFILSGR